MTLERSSSGDAFATFAFAVLRLSAHLQTAGDALAKPAGQTSARWQVLAAADHAPMSVADAARALGLTRQGVQRIADLLEKEGLIRYADNPAHLRAKLIMLTDDGRRAFALIQKRQTVWANALGAILGADDLDRATVTVMTALQEIEKNAVTD